MDRKITQGEAIQIMIQALDIVIGKSGLSRQMIVDVDKAIKTFTDPDPEENHKPQTDKKSVPS